MSSKFSFTLPTTLLDGSPIQAADLAGLKYEILIDTMAPPNASNPTCKVVEVPQKDVDAAVNGVVTVLFTDVAFAPVANQTYYAAAQDTEGTAVSPESNMVTFKNVVTPSAPGNFTVA